jgi:NAD(P)-dependent dehydrogenase (short-subunit alcohol dehydrogenase family)
MDYGIAGRTALVVGGSRGIGYDTARMLAGGCVPQQHGRVRAAEDD